MIINKTIKMLVEAISMIPRQFYSNITNDDGGVMYEKFVSQLAIRYRKIAGGYCRREVLLPSSEIIQKFASEENKIIVKKLAIGISSEKELKPTIFMEQTTDLPLLATETIIELKTDVKLRRGCFYWDFFKLHFLVSEGRCSCGVYFITNQDVASIQKKNNAYYERGFFTSSRPEKIFFLITKDYNANLFVLDYKGENIFNQLDVD